eukprot:TRINITY_DN19347_c0_g1_i1.p1 TRINITY_DN19347_c0_g1~~TRINITY_DN19347_c0_g1_i1.p1  ORF type:complete len:271 (-),score=9.51 TRINITY_DN19347_c0_g1_i1:209-988(-)
MQGLSQFMVCKRQPVLAKFPNSRQHRIQKPAVSNGYPQTQYDITATSYAEPFHKLENTVIWEGTEEADIWQGSVDLPLSPVWKLMLLSEGSVTRHLQTMSGLHVEVDCLQTKELNLLKGQTQNGHGYQPPYDLPKEVYKIPGNRLLQRQVLLRSPDPEGLVYVYAASWWNASTMDKYLKDKDQPMWISLSKEKTEMYREIQRIFCGSNKQLEEYFGVKDQFWGRQYVFWHRGEILTVLYEVFSSKLQQFLGPYENVRNY